MRDREALKIAFDRLKALRGYVTTQAVRVDLRKLVEDLDHVLNGIIEHANAEPEKLEKQIKQLIHSDEMGLFALCEDNSIWTLFNIKGTWTLIPGIPDAPSEEVKK